MASAVVQIGAGMAIGYLLRDAQLSDAERVAQRIGAENIQAFGQAFGNATLDACRVAVASVAFLIGEFPMHLFRNAGDLFISVFEWGVVKPIEFGVGILSTGMEAVAHTIALMVLGIVFFPVFLPVLFLLPAFLPLLIPIFVMRAIFDEVTRPLRGYA